MGPTHHITPFHAIKIPPFIKVIFPTFIYLHVRTNHKTTHAPTKRKKKVPHLTHTCYNGGKHNAIWKHQNPSDIETHINQETKALNRHDSDDYNVFGWKCGALHIHDSDD